MGVAIADASDSALPDQVLHQYKEISATDVMDEAASGSISYDNVAIIGDLRFDNNKYSTINITNSIIEGNVSLIGTTISDRSIFKNTIFREKAIFFGTRFNSEADFNGSRFEQDANFSDAVFGQGTTFDYVVFNKSADFSAASFDKFASLYNATFAGDASFFLSQFNGFYANFEFTRFLDNADFTSSQFSTFLSFMNASLYKTADFHASRFTFGVNFRNSTFQGDAKFSRCHFFEDSVFLRINFNGTADFMSAKFDGPSFFNSTIFRGNALFDSAQFLGPSDITDAEFDKDLAMNSTKISTMVLEGSTFHAGSRLFLGKADINRLMVKWSQIENILAYDTSAYLSLVKNYRDMGTSDADDCYYQFRKVTQDLRTFGWAKVLDMLANITCGYGVRADRPVICSLFLVLICTSILWRGNGLRSPSNKEKRTSYYDALYYCLAIFFTIPLPDLKPAGRYRYVPVFLRAIAWTLFALLIATLGKVMIK